MVRERYKVFSYLHTGADFVLLNFSFMLAYYLRFKTLSYSEHYLLLQMFVNLAWIAGFIVLGFYKDNLPVNKLDTGVRKTLRGFIIFLIFYLAFIVVTKGFLYSRIFHIYFLSLSFLVFVFDNFLVRWFTVRVFKSEKFKRNILIIGAGVLGKKFFESIRTNGYGYNVIGFLDDDEGKANDLNGRYLGKVCEFESVINKMKNDGITIDEVVITLPLENEKLIQDVTQIAEKNFINVKLIPSYHKLFLARPINFGQVDGMPVISFRDERLSYLRNRIIKRIFDIVFSSIVLVTIFPILYIFAAIGIKLSSKGPVFFKQLRKGYRGDPFVCYKFRTMKVVSQDIADYLQATPDDPRKTKFGHFLRKTNLDEFPQFINVLKGEMSVVGPRPHPIPLDEKYQDIICRYNVRFFTKPGITGWAQVNGYRGETRDPELMRKRVEHDIWYIENWSFWLDIKIILLTIWKMIKGDPNAY